MIPELLNYSDTLRIASHTKFTGRESEVTVCLVFKHNDKEIGQLLSVSHRTIGTHVRNLFIKLQVNRRKEIANFIESNMDYLDIKEFYDAIIARDFIHQKLANIGTRSLEQITITCYISIDTDDYYVTLINYLISYLSHANINVVIKSTKEKYTNAIINLPNNKKLYLIDDKKIKITTNENTYYNLYYVNEFIKALRFIIQNTYNSSNLVENQIDAILNYNKNLYKTEQNDRFYIKQKNNLLDNTYSNEVNKNLPQSISNTKSNKNINIVTTHKTTNANINNTRIKLHWRKNILICIIIFITLNITNIHKLLGIYFCEKCNKNEDKTIKTVSYLTEAISINITTSDQQKVIKS